MQELCYSIKEKQNFFLLLTLLMFLQFSGHFSTTYSICPFGRKYPLLRWQTSFTAFLLVRSVTQCIIISFSYLRRRSQRPFNLDVSVLLKQLECKDGTISARRTHYFDVVLLFFYVRDSNHDFQRKTSQSSLF